MNLLAKNTAEYELLGSILADRRVIDMAAKALKPKDFINHAFGEIYGEMIKLYETGASVDFVTVLEALKSSDGIIMQALTEEDKKEMLYDMMEYCVPFTDIPQLMEVVKGAKS